MFRLTLSGSLALSLMSFSLFGKSDEKKPQETQESIVSPEQEQPGYTINFNNVSFTEYLRFISRILNKNFVFEDADLQFTVTIVSEEPVSAKNIMSTLIQVLRIHGLSLLEEGDNFLITTNKTVNQIPTVVSQELPGSSPTAAPIITRVFRVKNANLTTLVNILRPMVSASALLEVSQETRQLIVTDITTNVEKIASLLTSLDTPLSPLEVDAYVAINISPKELITLATQIVTPFANGNPLILVPQVETNSVFVVSTPDLIERTMGVMADLDIPAKAAAGTAGAAEQHTFVLYPLAHAKGDQVVANLKKVAAHLSAANYPNADLIDAIDKIKWIEEDNSLILTGTKPAIEELKPMIARYDSESVKSSKTSFYIYKPVNKAPKEVEKSLQELARDLEASGLADIDLLHTVASAKHIPLTNSLFFTGTAPALEKLKELLATVDAESSAATQVQHVGSLTFFIYKIRSAPSSQLMTSITSFASDLQKAGSLDPELGAALASMKYIKETNSLLFTGTQAALEKVENLIGKFDNSSIKPKPEMVPIPNATFSLYTPHYRTGDELISILHDFEQNLVNSGVKDVSLFSTIDNLKWVEKTSSIIVSGEQVSIDKTLVLLQKFDTPEKDAELSSIESIDNTSFLVYKLQYHRGLEISDALKQVAVELGKKPTGENKNLAEAINSVQWITVTNSLLVSGEQDVLTKLRDLIANLDVPLKQVFIEVLVIETTLGNTQEFGLQWGGKLKYLNKVAAGMGNAPAANQTTGVPTFNTTPFSTGLNDINGTTTFPNPNPMLPQPGQGFDLGVLGDIIMHKGRSFISLGSLVNALQTDNDTTIVMNPKIITQDNNTSNIFVGQNLPYNSSVTTIQGSGVATSQTGNIEYRDIGFNLTITPVVGNNDVVTLDIMTDITSTLQVNTTSNFQVNGIATTHTSMSTKVHVPSDQFLVLSGMLNDTKTHFKSQIPCLGGLPVIGAAFSENDRSDQKDNIIIFVRPHIINSFDEYRQITERQEVLYKEQAILPILQEEFDAGIDWVKTPENECR